MFDGPGGFNSYSLLENYAVSKAQDLLPMGVSEGCTLLNDLAKDTPIRYADVALPKDRLVDRLRAQQDAHFPTNPSRETSAV